MREREELGATGRYPAGRLGPGDAGELRAALTADKKSGRIFLDFGKSLSWVAMAAAEARDFAAHLIAKVNELEG